VADNLTIETFQPHIGLRFRVGSGGEVELTLEEVSDLGQAPEGLPPPFSVLFRAAPGAELPQGSYELEREGFGRHSVFLVPIVTVDLARGRLHEAAFG